MPMRDWVTVSKTYIVYLKASTHILKNLKASGQTGNAFSQTFFILLIFSNQSRSRNMSVPKVVVADRKVRDSSQRDRDSTSIRRTSTTWSSGIRKRSIEVLAGAQTNIRTPGRASLEHTVDQRRSKKKIIFRYCAILQGNPHCEATAGVAPSSYAVLQVNFLDHRAYRST